MSEAPDRIYIDPDEVEKIIDGDRVAVYIDEDIDSGIGAGWIEYIHADSLPVAPELDWDAVPEWVQWAEPVISRTRNLPLRVGWAYYERKRPKGELTRGRWQSVTDFIDIPIGVDYRTIKAQQRPQENR